ncbi:glycosyltransferase [Flavobacteriaceae bacterium]|mgnify:FL=1|jgi:glycosyltransferase involved in cell wall biosynthesis|nr:glycosyltransferase [Flavobacteriaceae bacterium]
MTRCKVSILTTVYNREKYIAACIDSVLASSFQDWELIIVDDVSTDTSLAIAKSYEKKDARIKVYVNQTNLGDYPNRNKAASYAKGKYLKYLDADDVIYPHGLEIMVLTMEQFPEAALGISQKVVEDVKPYPFIMQPKETFKREFLMRGVLGLGPTGTIIRRDAFETLGGFTGTRYIGDTELWYKIALTYPVVKMEDNLIFWRQHDDQEITKGQDSFFYLENAFKLKFNTLQKKELPLEALERQMALKKLTHRFSRDIARLILKGHIVLANTIRKSCGISWIKIIKAL